jgi:hypothetical protein
MPIMTTRKNHSSGLKRWSEKNSFLNQCSFSWHDHFGEFLMGFAHSTKSRVFCVMWILPKVELGSWLYWFPIHFLVVIVSWQTSTYHQCLHNNLKLSHFEPITTLSMDIIIGYKYSIIHHITRDTQPWVVVKCSWEQHNVEFEL